MSSGQQNLAAQTSADTDVQAADPLVGTTIADRYLVEAECGMGAWSSVYQAKDLSLGRTVAIKVLHAYLAAQDAKLERFRKEALAASSILHPNITTVFDYGLLAKGQPFIVMEHLDGITLSDELRERGAIDLTRFLSLSEQLCSALEAAHAKGVLHRDIKPSNIMLVQTEGSSARIAKLVDFGLAKSFIEQSGSMTATGETMGTPAYMSPEQCRGAQLDSRSDIYSLGCVLYEMLTGVKAFQADAPWECMHKHLNEAPKSFKEVAPKAQIPAVVESIVRKALEKNPKDRFHSISDLKNALSVYQSKVLKKESVLGNMQLRRAIGLPYFKASQVKSKAVLMGTTLIVAVIASILVIGQRFNPPITNNVPAPANGARTFTGNDGTVWQHVPLEIMEFPASGIGEIWSVNDTGMPTNFMGKAQGKVEIPTGRRFAVNVSTAGLAQMAWFKTVKNPWLSVINFEGESVKLSVLQSLKDLPGLSALHFKGVPFTDDQIFEFKNVPHITALALNGAHISDKGLLELSQSVPDLKWLSLRNDRFSTAGLGTLKLFPKLTSLDLSAMHKLTSTDLEQISQLKQLTSLNLARTRLTATGTAYLSGLTQLRVLSLARSGIDDNAVKNLATLKNLISLNLRGNEDVTDESIETIGKLKSLRLLETSRTNITPDGIERLSKLNPDCHVTRQWEAN